jgi:predicted Zn-dependent protease
MALSESVEASLKEAEQSLRNALAFAARQEKPFVSKHIADMMTNIENIIDASEILDKLENRNPGDSGIFDSWFNTDE